MDSDLLQETALVINPGDIDGVSVAIPGLLGDMGSGGDPETQKQPRKVINQKPRRGRVVDPSTLALLVDGDRPVGRPDVSDEQGNLPLGHVEDRLWDELLMATETEERQLVQPLGDRIALAMAKRKGCVKPQRRTARSRVVITYGRHAKDHCCLGDRTEVLLIDAGVPNRLPFDERTVTEHVSEQHDLVVIPGLEVVWRRDVSRHTT